MDDGESGSPELVCVDCGLWALPLDCDSSIGDVGSEPSLECVQARGSEC